MQTFTIDEIMDLKPCNEYTRERVEELWDGRESLSLLEICDLPIPVDDIFWVVLLNSDLSDQVKHDLACDFAEHVLHIFESKYPDDKRPRECISIARDPNSTPEQLCAAGAAARDSEQQWQLSRVKEVLGENAR
jgi:hypothetical protein